MRIGELTIDRRFCGPPDSANGGYACGRLAGYVDGLATVRLMKPPPLDVPIAVHQRDGELELRHGEEIIARAWPGGPDVDVPEAPPLESARARRAYYAGVDDAVFETCFVCGIAREEGDGLRIHAGPDPEAGHDPSHHAGHVACTWSPHPSLCRDDGTVPTHFVWAALDCPSGWAFLSAGDEVALLGEFSAEVLTPLQCGQEYIVAGWEISREGRKRRTGSALYAADGAPVARALATWIIVQPSAQ